MPDNIHASAVVVGECGVLITGRSGSGKSGLAVSLVAYAGALGHFARLVGDDQLLLSARGGRLFCTAPAAIAGLVEIRGAGPRPIAHEETAPVDLVVELVARDDAPRYQEPGTRLLAGCRVPVLRLPGEDAAVALRAVVSWLALPPFR